MSYTYKDPSNDDLHIMTSPGGEVWLQINHGDTGWLTTIKQDDAPSVALALLEAAGVKPSLTASLDCPEHYERRALAHLETARKLRERKAVEQAEREALDGKVRAYLNRVLLNKVGDMYRITDHDRAEYARAAEFFQGPDKKVHNHAFGSAPADPCNACGPRVLNCGDPEPDRGTKWKHQHVAAPKEVRWTEAPQMGDAPGWTFGAGNYGRKWSDLSTDLFPMTEVKQ